jgi:hypothetical protein
MCIKVIGYEHVELLYDLIRNDCLNILFIIALIIFTARYIITVVLEVNSTKRNGLMPLAVSHILSDI